MAVPAPLAGQGWTHARRALASASAGMPFALFQSSLVTFSPATLEDRGQQTVAMAQSRHLMLLDLIQAVSGGGRGGRPHQQQPGAAMRRRRGSYRGKNANAGARRSSELASSITLGDVFQPSPLI